MPKVFLTAADREKNRETNLNEVISFRVRANKARKGVKDKDLADVIGISIGSLVRYKDPEKLGLAPLNIVRKIVKECGVSAEEWLKAGGFGPSAEK